MSKRLIEQWMPAAQVGAESIRERGAATALPPINFMHVWWARRPLTASRAAILLSLLPAWPTLKLEELFPDGKEQYYDWVTRALGIFGDSVAGRKAIAKANEQRLKLKGNGYGTVRAFTVSPDASTRTLISKLLPSEKNIILDPFSGGGSIPFEAMRYGFSVVANELNPVAAAILTATIDLPFAFGFELAGKIETFGKIWSDRVRSRLEPFFPLEPGANTGGYIWAHAVPCPTTGYPTPLAPNLWLANGDGKSVALEMVTNSKTGFISFAVHSGDDAAIFGQRSTYRNGIGVSVWDNGTFDGDYIRSCAKNGTMTDMLLAVVIDKGKGRQFRAPTKADLNAIDAAKRELLKRLPNWEAQDLVPCEERFVGPADRSAQYGVTRFRDMFTPRQLLANITILDELRSVSHEAISELGEGAGKAVALYLALSFDRAIDYNSNLSSWDSSRNKIRNTFDRHDFSFKWTFAEFEAARELVPWIVKHTITNYTKLLRLTPAIDEMFAAPSGKATIVNGSATDLATIADASVHAIITDPPYYDNVMYAECSDFFYAWLKRALRDTWPQFCELELTDKQREAVANAALFKDVATHKGAKKKGQTGKTAAELADANYERLLTESFKEAYRVLKPDGIMTVMFTHKRVDAWDTLGSALLNSGFTIESSWPIATESENSLHQAKKNSASSTIFLTCRKRQSSETMFWSDIKDEIARTTEAAVQRFAKDGLSGVDLTLATYGPALSVLSKHWPVYTGNVAVDGSDEVIAPDAALNLAREKVAELKKRGLLDGRSMDFDRPTDWYLIAWSDFKAREFPSGEAIKLSMAMHLDLDELAKSYRLCTAKAGWTTILSPEQRRAAGAVDPSKSSYASLVDALHALMLVVDEEGLNAARVWLTRANLGESEQFKALVAAAIKAIPRVKKKGEFEVPEAKTLETIRATLFDSIQAPSDDAEQLTLV